MTWALPGKPVSPTSFMARLNGQFFRTYRLLAWIGGLYWFVLGGLGLLGLTPRKLVPLRFLGVALLWGFGLAMRLEPDPVGRRVERWGLGLASIFVLICGLVMAARPDPYLMMNFIMLALVFGVTFRRLGHCVTALGLNLAVSAALSPWVPPERRWLILLAILFSTGVGLVLHRLFGTLFHRLEQLDLKRTLLARQRARLVRELRQALAQVKTLGGLIPICAGCKSIRNDQGYWEGVETFLERNTDVGFTHGYCPACAERLRAEFEELGREGRGEGGASPAADRGH